ncbi:MAG: Trk system potassium transporter TrkA [Muribaculaceae bacterium]|jgi:trk system potassium uptake protein TrkA|nr:Trk system potassium transporter TrkA [Muribaculaceae bacterium]
MKIVIAGAGEVGSHLAKLLSREEQDIILIDKDADKLAVIDANYNLMTLRGSPMSFKVLKEAGVEQCDLFIAVTPFETNNVIAASVAKSLGARKTVARIDNYEFMEREHAEFFSRMGVNRLIYPEYLAAQEIITSLERTWVRTWFEIHNGELIVVGVKIRDANATLCGMQLKQLAMQQHFFHVAAIRRSHETIIPRGDDRISLNDIVYFTTTRDHIDSIREMCGKRQEEIRKVLIMGGSRIAIRLIALAGSKYRFKIIDIDRAHCEKLCERCEDTRIVHGDARDIETLIEEGIDDMDAFIALTNSSETNILASLSAKEHGVRKTIAEVEDLQFISEAENLNIGTVINKKLLASSKIFQLLLDTDSSSSKFMALADADVAEIEVKPKSKITKAPVKDLNLSRDMTIAGLIRDGKGMLVSGNTHIQPGDRVVVFCLSGAIHKIERIFN